jgi:hypothetical protein
MAIPRFIQLRLPLPPLKPMDQSRRGVSRIGEAQAHPLIMAIPRSLSEGALVPPAQLAPHAVIDPSSLGGTGAPSDNGYTKIYSNGWAFATLKADGSIKAWGNSKYGGTGAPSDNGYTKIAPVPPSSEPPHAVIDPSALRAAKAPQVE